MMENSHSSVTDRTVFSTYVQCTVTKEKKKGREGKVSKSLEYPGLAASVEILARSSKVSRFILMISVRPLYHEQTFWAISTSSY